MCSRWATSIFPIAGPATLRSPVMAYRISATRSASTSPRDITGLVSRVSHAGHQVALQMLGEADDLTAWNRLTFQKYPLRSFAAWVPVSQSAGSAGRTNVHKT